MEEKTEQQLRHIKLSFRLMMNGPASQSMREKGVDYKLNWGVPFPQLKAMAKDYVKDYDLAIALWKEDIRECKILATLIMPVEKMEEDLAALWMEQVRSQEMAEMIAFNLLQFTDYGPDLAFRWIATGKELYQICGYNILSRVFMRGEAPNERGINEYLDQAESDLEDGTVGVKHAAANSINRFMDLGEDYEKIAIKALGDRLG